MFLVRSAFWLTVAFVAFHPRDVDLGATASSLSGQAIAAGQRAVVSEVIKNDCVLLRCAPAIAPGEATASLSLPSDGALKQATSPARAVPYPRPRPAWMG
jgi:hypothetical protein